MKTAINKSFETIINRYLDLDPESEKRLAALEGKIITIDLRVLETVLYLRIKNNKIIFEESLSEEPDVVIKGTPLSLLRVSLTKENRKKLFAEDVIIEGNLELGQQIIDLFDSMEIDWEEHLSRLTGDVSAHQVGRLVRGIKDIVERVRESVSQNINEYVHEEVMLFPPREALNDFFDDIDILRMDIDRLEARIKRLQQLSKDAE